MMELNINEELNKNNSHNTKPERFIDITDYLEKHEKRGKFDKDINICSNSFRNFTVYIFIP